MDMLLSILVFLIAIFLLIGIHELGHFLCARLCGIHVKRFSIGFGKPLIRWSDKHQTEWVIAIFPFGGYVKLLDETEEPLNQKQSKQAYHRHPIHHRFFVLIGGVLFNFLFAIFASWGLYTIGDLSIKPIIDSVIPNSIAGKAKIPSSSLIVKVDNEKTKNWQDVLIHFLYHIGDEQPIILTTKHLKTQNETTHQLNMKQWNLDHPNTDLLTSLGIKPLRPKTKQQLHNMLVITKYPFSKAFIAANQATWKFTKLNFLILWKFISGKLSLAQLSGPLGLFKGVEQSRHHLSSFLKLLGIVSISLAVINILPIPGLDGGHLFFLLLELFLRRPVSPAVQLLCYRLGIIFLVVLLIHATMNDLVRLLE